MAYSHARLVRVTSLMYDLQQSEREELRTMIAAASRAPLQACPGLHESGGSKSSMSSSTDDDDDWVVRGISVHQ